MDYSKIGGLIKSLRKEKGMTQLELASQLNISDKTVSKWERGLGCPDVSLLAALSLAFQVDLESLLSGNLEENHVQGGNMKRTSFYVCPVCGNVVTAGVDAAISCCGRKLDALTAVKEGDGHTLRVERMENDYYITTDHDMEKEHCISFMALVTGDTVLIRRQYPEWNLQVRIPLFAHGRLYWYCTQHGLFYRNV